MPEVTQEMMDYANFMETYVEPLFFFPVSVYLVIVEVANWLVGTFLPSIQALISAWTG